MRVNVARVPKFRTHRQNAGRKVNTASLSADNDVYGSIHGCADDFRPGRWYDDANRWSGRGVTYF